jgi:hypothetical protein
LLAALIAAPVSAQTPVAPAASPAAADPRPALPTFFGDTGLWFVPTAEVLPAGRFSVSAYRANYDRLQGLSDVSQFGITGAFGIAGRVEVFGSWRLVRVDRDVRPLFAPAAPDCSMDVCRLPTD